jgi:hypothetical protein
LSRQISPTSAAIGFRIWVYVLIDKPTLSLDEAKYNERVKETGLVSASAILIQVIPW